MVAAARLRCPVCRARFRETVVCSRCGADLSALMGIAVRAFRARTTARRALREGRLDEAHTLATHAQALYATPAGRDLALLLRWARAR